MPGKRIRSIFLAESLLASPKENFQYLDFHDFPALATNPRLMEQIVLSYQTIFGDPDGWAEQYTHAEVLQKLSNELAGQAGLRICLADTDQIAGFCWAQVLQLDEIAAAIGSIKYYQSIGAPEVISHLQPRLGDGKVLYLHDLGIDTLYRGRIPLTQLIYPVLDALAQRSGVDTVLFWSVADTKISKLAKRALFHRIFALDEMRFYSGKIGASKTRPRLKPALLETD